MKSLSVLLCVIALSTLDRAMSLNLPKVEIQTDYLKASSLHSLNVENTLNEVVKANIKLPPYRINELACPAKGFNGQETIPWGYKAMNVESITRLNNLPINICVLDSGFDANHPDLKGLNISYEALTLNSPEMKDEPFRKFLLEKDLYLNRSLNLDPSIGIGNVDYAGTGTATIGMLAALRNKFGTRGLISGKLRIHMVKGISFALYGQSQNLLFGADMVGALRRCQKINPKIIIVNSVAFGNYNEREDRYFQELYRKNVLVFAPAGNVCSVYKPCLTDLFSYPASYSRVISVGSLSNTMRPMPTATRSSAVLFSGPAARYLTTVPSNYASYLVNQAGVGSCVTIKSKLMNLTVAATLAFGSYGASVRAPVGPCYFGLSKCGRVKGKICMVLVGGGASALRKAYYCQKGGAVAAVIVPTTTESVDLVSYAGNAVFKNTTVKIPIILTSYTPGQRMYSFARKGSNARVSITATREKYRYVTAPYLASTSVAAAAALVWRNHPLCTNTEIIDALKRTAKDVGQVGVDNVSGYGLPDPRYASAYLSRKVCNAYRKK